MTCASSTVPIRTNKATNSDSIRDFFMIASENLVAKYSACFELQPDDCKKRAKISVLRGIPAIEVD